MELSLRRLPTAFLGLLAVGLTLASPLGVGASTTTTAPVTTTTAPASFANDATVTVAVSHLPGNYNFWTPAGSDEVTSMVMEQVWPQASVIDNKLQTEMCTVSSGDCPSALLVSAEPVSLDPMTVVYQIAPKATWSDGVPITGADFAYLASEVVEEAASLPATDPISGYEDIKSLVTSGGGKTVTVTFTQPYADWQSLFTYLVPAHIAIAGGMTAPFVGSDPAALISGGPYEVTHVIKGKEVVLARNPHYWGVAGHIERLIFRVEPTDADTMHALQTGKVTIGELTPGPAVRSLVQSTTFLVSHTSYSPEFWQLAFNFTDPVVGQYAVRDAVALAIDRHQLVADTLNLDSSLSSIVGNRLFARGLPGGVGDDAAYEAVDDAGADALLSGVGYHLNSAGLAAGAGDTPLTLNLVGPSDDPLMAEVEGELQAELLQAGIELRLHNEPLAQLLGSTLSSGSYQIALVPYDVSPYLSTTSRLYEPAASATPAAPTTSTPTTAAPTTSDTAAAGATGATGPSGLVSIEPERDSAAAVTGVVSSDVLGLDDPRLAPLFSEAASELSPSSEDSVYNSIDVDLWQDLATLPLFQMPVTVVYNNALQGVEPGQTWQSFLADAQDWSWELNAPPTSTTTSTTSSTTTTSAPAK